MKDTRVTPNEAAKLLNVSADQVRQWCESGELPSYRSIHGWRKIDRKELIAFSRRRTTSAPTNPKTPNHEKD